MRCRRWQAMFELELTVDTAWAMTRDRLAQLGAAPHMGAWLDERWDGASTQGRGLRSLVLAAAVMERAARGRSHRFVAEAVREREALVWHCFREELSLEGLLSWSRGTSTSALSPLLVGSSRYEKPLRVLRAAQEEAWHLLWAMAHDAGARVHHETNQGRLDVASQRLEGAREQAGELRERLAGHRQQVSAFKFFTIFYKIVFNPAGQRRAGGREGHHPATPGSHRGRRGAGSPDRRG